MDCGTALAKQARLNPCDEALRRCVFARPRAPAPAAEGRFGEKSGSQFGFARKPLNSLDSRKKEAWISLPLALNFLPNDLDFPSPGFANPSTHFGKSCPSRLQPCDSRRARQDFAESGRRRMGDAAIGINPADCVDFVAHARFAAAPASDERRDDEVRAHAAPLALNCVDKAVEGDDVRFDAHLFPELACDGLLKRLAELDHAAGQGKAAVHRLARPAADEAPPVSKHRRRDGENWPRGKQPVTHAPSQAWPPALSRVKPAFFPKRACVRPLELD